jgi:stage IV sporulation protein B
LQSTKEHQGGAALAHLFRSLLVWTVALVTALSLSPGAQAAGEERSVIPLGQAVGIKLFSQGVLVVGLTDVTTAQGPASPAKTCGLQEGDVITHIDGAQVSSIEEVQTILQTAQGQELELQVLRDESSQELTTRAVQCSADGAYKLGAWIRDSMAGIGTLTFVDPESGLFGTLGHGINDVDTAVLMKLQSGAITPASVASVVKGLDGQPGELRGSFSADTDLGTLYANTEQGVFGHLKDPAAFRGQAVPVAQPQEVHTGEATILANIVGSTVEEYSVEILKVYNDAADTRDLMLQVTDPRLLDQTGGIVQGMSGSPILQDGKLVGAVTHVLIDHADRGYGIFAQHMLDAAQKAEA